MGKTLNFSCPDCPKTYVSKAWFDKHVLVCATNKNKVASKISKQNSATVKKLKHLKCPRCGMAYSGQLCFTKHVNKCTVEPTPSDLSQAFDFADEYFSEISTSIEIPTTEYLSELSSFSASTSGFKFIHLNVNSLFNKKDHIIDIADTKEFDLIFLNETKLDHHVPQSFMTHANYNILRRDRNGRGGGIMVLCKREYNIISSSTDSQYELLVLQLSIKNVLCNFICCYKSPSINANDFTSYLDNYLLSVDLSLPLFIVGDLNFNLTTEQGLPLEKIMANYQLRNFVEKPTRIAHRVSNRNHKSVHKSIDKSTTPDLLSFMQTIALETHSSTLIDVVLHNGDLITGSDVLGCPFSDHKFVVAALKLTAHKKLPPIKFLSRCLSPSNLEKIGHLLTDAMFLKVTKLDDPADKLKFIQTTILKVVDSICPLKSVSKKVNEQVHPWIDRELQESKHNRDLLYKLASLSSSKTDWSNYKESRRCFQSLNRKKMIHYFESKQIKNFKNSKKFWQFYKSSIKLKSDVSTSDMPTTMTNGDQSVSTFEDIASMFNSFFTSISSVSLTSKDECHCFINDHFKQLKRDSIISPGSFSFTPVSTDLVGKFIARIDDTSSPGNAGISPKILKLAPDILVPVYTALFNSCIEKGIVPHEWKSAIVSPLFKNKGVKSDMNNYRGISVLSPLSKVFEKLLNEQIVAYLDKHNILFEGQHGFRKGHSCETALHELITDINTARDKRLTSMLLFIDYRKAFDTVDSDLLLLKLFHYGFDNSALKLIADYFANRSQSTKVNGKLSGSASIPLGVPQGSCLGPLFFLIFINDLAYLLVGLHSKLFADDTTIYSSGPILSDVIGDFQKRIKPLGSWCALNRLDINWSKTYVMFITNSRITLPTSVALNDVTVSVVTEFKLLGVTLDNKLNFNKHIAIMCRQINSKLFSIKRLFVLSTSVKMQFFKTFVLPYFDYCISLLVYFPKLMLQKLSKCFYLCLYKLFNYKFYDCQPNDINTFLTDYGLFAFEHRVLFRLLTFTNKLVFKLENGDTAPTILKSYLHQNKDRQSLAVSDNLTDHNLRNQSELDVAVSRTKFGDMTFCHIFPKFINLTCASFVNLKPSEFSVRAKQTINSLFSLIETSVAKQLEKFAIFAKIFLV